MCCGSWQARHSRVDNKKQKKDWHSASPFLLDRNHALHTYAVLGLVAGCAALISCVGEKIIRCAAVEVVPGAQLPPNVKAERHHACRNGDPADCACQGTRFCCGFGFFGHRLTPGTIGRLQNLSTPTLTPALILLQMWRRLKADCHGKITMGIQKNNGPIGNTADAQSSPGSGCCSTLRNSSSLRAGGKKLASIEFPASSRRCSGVQPKFL